MTDFIGRALPSRIVWARPPTNLFRIAADELGDALMWWRIAALNGLSDPWIVGPLQLKIPATASSNNGGVPNG